MTRTFKLIVVATLTVAALAPIEASAFDLSNAPASAAGMTAYWHHGRHWHRWRHWHHRHYHSVFRHWGF